MSEGQREDIEQLISEKLMCPRCFQKTTEDDYISRKSGRLTKTCTKCRDGYLDHTKRGHRKSYYKRKVHLGEKVHKYEDVLSLLDSQILKEKIDDTELYAFIEPLLRGE
jgi:hypothetical protein